MHLQVFIIALLLTSTALNAVQGGILVPRQKLLMVSLLRTLEQTGMSKLLSILSAFLPDFKRCSHGLKT